MKRFVAIAALDDRMRLGTVIYTSIQLYTQCPYRGPPINSILERCQDWRWPGGREWEEKEQFIGGTCCVSLIVVLLRSNTCYSKLQRRILHPGASRGKLSCRAPIAVVPCILTAAVHSDSGRSRLFGNAIQVLKHSRIELALGNRPYLQGRCLVLLPRLVLMVRPKCIRAYLAMKLVLPFDFV